MIPSVDTTQALRDANRRRLDAMGDFITAGYQLRDQLRQAIADGMTVKEASRILGINERTIKLWVRADGPA